MCFVCLGIAPAKAFSLASRFVAEAVAPEAGAAAAPRGRPMLVANVQVFDGINDRLEPKDILIEDDKIRRVSSGMAAPPGGSVIDGRGHVLIPGLIDAHWHMTFAPNTLQDLQQSDTGLMYANTVAEAHRTLLRGFTTVRDVGGPTFGIKAAIDGEVIPGPRVFPSGALISQTAGHGDFGAPYASPLTLGGQQSRFEQIGDFAVVNGVPEVLAATRQQLKKGASQIKLAVGGGVISDFDPIDSIGFTTEELRAAVQAAAHWGTYVATHVYTVAGIRHALDCGVMSIEHGHLADEDTVRLIGERGAWLSTQAFEPGDEPLSPAALAKTRDMVGAWQRILGWARQHGTRVAFGTDLLFQPNGTGKQNLMLTRFARVFSNFETLRIATSGNAELLAMSGRRNPYQEAKLGVIEEGAWADMLLVRGDPRQNIDLLKDYERNLLVIMKAGMIYKNLLG